jgi:glycosyltransferase involved in cell wall biosynthesis
VAGLRDSVNNNETGLLAEAGSVEDLADKLVAVLKDDVFRESLSRNALDYSRQFSWDESAEAFLKVIQRVS